MSNQENQPPLRYFQASKLGNGAGLTVLQRELPEGENCRTLTIHVLPKFWRQSDTGNIAFTLPKGINTDTFHTFVYEMDVIGLDESWSTELLQIVPSEQKQDSAKKKEQGRSDPLWKETQSCHELAPLTVLNPRQADAFWQLVNTHDMEPAPLPDRVDLPPSGTSILPDVPQLKIQFYRQFLTQAEEAVRQRKPVFLQTQEELGFVRGRMVSQGLVKRKIYNRLPVLCEYDSMTADYHIWQIVRAAVQITGQVEDSSLQARSLEVDAHLRDVGIKTSSALLTENLSSTELARISSSLRNTYLLARSILAKQLGVGYEEPRHSGGVITNLKIVSSDLWEKIVAHYLKESMGTAPEEKLKLHLYYDENGIPAASAKKPDLVLKAGNKTFVFDAKYKFQKQRISGASMSDQYQLTTYAYRMAADAFLVYAHKPGDETLEPVFFYLAYPGNPATDNLDSGQLSHRIGVLSLPFPGPDEAGFFEGLSIKDLQKELLPERKDAQTNKQTV